VLAISNKLNCFITSRPLYPTGKFLTTVVYVLADPTCASLDSFEFKTIAGFELGLLGVKLSFVLVNRSGFLVKRSGFFSVGKHSCIAVFPLSCLVFCLPPWTFVPVGFIMVNLIFCLPFFVSFYVFIFLYISRIA